MRLISENGLTDLNYDSCTLYTNIAKGLISAKPANESQGYVMGEYGDEEKAKIVMDGLRKAYLNNARLFQFPEKESLRP